MGINDLHFTDEDLDELAEKLAAVAPIKEDEKKVMFANSGAYKNVTKAFPALESSPISSWKLRSLFLRNLRTFAGTDNQRS